MTKNERYVKIFEDEVFYITDTKNKKTYEDFRKEIALDNPTHSVDILNQVAEEEYNDYLYENSMTATEITDALNNYEKVNQGLYETNTAAYHKLLNIVNDLNRLEIAIEKVKRDYENVPIVQEAIEKIIMTKRELKP